MAEGTDQHYRRELVATLVCLVLGAVALAATWESPPGGFLPQLAIGTFLVSLTIRTMVRWRQRGSGRGPT